MRTSNNCNSQRASETESEKITPKTNKTNQQFVFYFPFCFFFVHFSFSMRESTTKRKKTGKKSTDDGRRHECCALCRHHTLEMWLLLSADAFILLVFFFCLLYIRPSDGIGFGFFFFVFVYTYTRTADGRLHATIKQQCDQKFSSGSNGSNIFTATGVKAWSILITTSTGHFQQ